jgi:protocatechuate 3,4-dioxygenase beta subunit
MKMERCLKLCKGIFLALAWIIAQSLSAQTITVSGNVSDVSGEPLIGVTIQVANSSVGTVTNFNGNYTLSGVSPNAVSFIIENAIGSISSSTFSYFSLISFSILSI